MTLARISCFVFALLVVTMGQACAAVFYPSHFTLANGMQVVVVPNHLSPVVSQMVWYKVGSADETPGKSGLAHYLEHLMFRGTANVGPGEFSKIIAAQGGKDNAFTSRDYTVYYEEVAVDRLPMIMQMEADRMQNLRIMKETAEPELKVVLEERQQRTDNSPQGRFIEKLQGRFMPGHPYGRPIIGWKKEVERLSVSDARKFYETYYAPNNAIVIVSGDVKVEDVVSLAAATFGRVPKRDVPPRRAFRPAGKVGEETFVYRDARIEQAEILWRFEAPSYATQKEGNAYAYEVLAEALDAGEVGLLYKKLVMDLGIASEVGAGYDPDARGDADLTIAVSLRPGQSYKKLQDALRATLHDIAEKGIDPKSVDDAKRRLRRAAIFAREGLAVPGHAFGMALTTGSLVSDVEDWPDRIDAVSVDEVNGALREMVAAKRQVMGALLPSSRASALKGRKGASGLLRGAKAK